MKSNGKLPVPTIDGLTLREYAIREAQAWQRSVIRENTPTPTPIYLIVRDLLAEVLKEH